MNFDTELKKLWNMGVKVIIAVGGLGAAPKGLERGLEGLVTRE